MTASTQTALKWTGLAVAVASAGTGLLAAAVPAWAGSAVPAELVAVVALLLLALAEPLASAALAVQRVPALSAALAELSPLLEAAPAVLPAEGMAPRPVTTLALDGVEVTWPGAARPVFPGVTTSVSRSEWLVIDGPSGSGKSTLLSALLGALPLSAGRIAADGVPLTAITADGWSRRIAWCPQDAHVFDSTLRGNLLLSRPRTEPVDDADGHRHLATQHPAHHVAGGRRRGVGQAEVSHWRHAPKCRRDPSSSQSSLRSLGPSFSREGRREGGAAPHTSPLAGEGGARSPKGCGRVRGRAGPSASDPKPHASRPGARAPARRLPCGTYRGRFARRFSQRRTARAPPG